MNLNSAQARDLLQRFEFSKLFIDVLGWDRPGGGLAITVEGRSYALHAIAQKRGVQVFECASDSGMPDYSTRRKIDRQVAKSAAERLVIFRDSARLQQVWQWVARTHGQPDRCREHHYHASSHAGDALLQKLSAINIPVGEEESLDLTGTLHKLHDAFDRDRVTKKFYERFKSEHAAFLKFIRGIGDTADREWYASLMLNRMMFVYFIQKKGFLDGDADYLRNRLDAVRGQKGKGQFLTFYRYFLLKLFHEGFGKQPQYRELDQQLTALIGYVPYLNGGLFDVHKLEDDYPEIDVPDEAFAQLFDFFDQYDWHLDTRPLRNDKEINPDVLGYIFEKYINQKEKSAYYTKEDITEYIGKNTILPWVLDAAAQECSVAFENGSALWRLLSADPDRYVYPAMRRGVIDAEGQVIPLPAEIEAGVADVGQRGGWNKPAPLPFGLPTETWREYVARRQRCLDLRDRLRRGEVHAVNDFITLNLDIRRFVTDAIIECEGSDLLLALWKSLRRVTVLDPTCGSGAFLFAALNILEPLYQACLERMQSFVDDMATAKRPGRADKFKEFRAILADAATHTNLDYFILKSIVVNNLFGVDIMEEAVEICKLRLFLKLVAQIETADQLEPLPDIDFNIRAGNTLVGYTKVADVQRSLAGNLGFQKTEVNEIVKEAENIDRLFRGFQQMQSEHELNAVALSALKRDLRNRLGHLTDQFDHHLYGDYHAGKFKEKEFAAWKKSHQPFHWFAEFYGIMNAGGFDVLIGNPPWKEIATLKSEYRIHGYITESCGNLHCVCTERAINLRNNPGHLSFIVQLPLTSSSRMQSARTLLVNNSSSLFVIPFDDRPGKLFDGLEHCRSVIFLSGDQSNGAHRLFTTRYQRWPTEARAELFAGIEYADAAHVQLLPGLFPKYATPAEVSAFAKVKSKSRSRIGSLTSQHATKHFIFYQEATQYWVKATLGLPYYAKDGIVGPPAHGRYLYFNDATASSAACAVLNSSLFYAYFIANGDCFHLSDSLVTQFPIPESIANDRDLADLGKQLQKSLDANAIRKTINSKKTRTTIEYAEFYVSVSKPILDRIDQHLGNAYGFTPVELDFIINYDIKYRMGQEDEEEEE